MATERGSQKLPGKFRTPQNWIGGSRPGNGRFVPPPPENLIDVLGAFERFLHDDKINLPTLFKVALAHVQFETIHPFLDGNGRLLITFTLCAEGILKEPLLYLNLYFKANRQDYYDHLQTVREHGDWEEWIEFFLKGVIYTANQAVETAQQIVNLFNKHRVSIESSGKSTTTILSIHHYFQQYPVSNTGKIKLHCNISLPTVLRSLKTLSELSIIEEVTGKERNYIYREYIDILNKGTESVNNYVN